MYHLSERDSEFNQKQTTYVRRRERPFFSTPLTQLDILIGSGIMLLSAQKRRLWPQRLDKPVAE